MKKKKEVIASDASYPLELKKHVAVIHSSSKISLLQRKIANALLYNAYEHLDRNEEHQIQIKALCDLIGYDSHDHKSIKNALVDLLSTVIEWNLMNDRYQTDEGVWNASSIIADASIDGSICTYSYSNKMRKLLYRPHIYGRLDMKVQSRFQSSYGLALYENCNRYQDIGHTPWFEMAKFRRLMGVEDYKYKVFRDFKQRVLNKAIEEVNKYSPIHISVLIRKEKRKVVAIQFQIMRQNIILTAPSATYQQQIAKYLAMFGLSARQITNVMNKYELEYIHDKIRLVEASSSFKNGLINNTGKYLLCALKDDYKQPKKSNVNQKITIEKQLNPLSELNDREQYRRYQDAQALVLFNAYNKAKQKRILQEFEVFLGKSIYHDLYLRDGLKNILIRDQLAKFLLLYKEDILTTILSFPAWQAESKLKAS